LWNVKGNAGPFGEKMRGPSRKGVDARRSWGGEKSEFCMIEEEENAGEGRTTGENAKMRRGR